MKKQATFRKPKKAKLFGPRKSKRFSWSWENKRRDKNRKIMKLKKKKKVIRTKKNVEERISSGIEGFDELIENGFDKGSVNLLVGESGSGKTIFAIQFLVDGLRKGEKCLFITFEEKKDEFYENMLDFGWDLADYEKKGKFFFLEYSPEKVKSMIEEGGGEIESIVVRHKITRLVIDSITSFALLFEDELEKRETALALFDIIRNWDTTSILTSQENPIYRKREGASSLEFEADSIILIYFVRKKKERKRFIEILKMRGTKHSAKIHLLEFSKKGLKVLKEVYNGKIG